MDWVRELWIFRTESVVTERFKNNDVHNEGTREETGRNQSCKESCEYGETTWKGQKIHHYQNSVALYVLK
jgi:hypothetical protein